MTPTADPSKPYREGITSACEGGQAALLFYQEELWDEGMWRLRRNALYRTKALK